MDWTYRLILGDSLVIMGSLTKREDLAEKVQIAFGKILFGVLAAVAEFGMVVRTKEGLARAGARGSGWVGRQVAKARGSTSAWVTCSGGSRK